MKFQKLILIAALMFSGPALVFSQTLNVLPDQVITFSIRNAGLEVEGSIKVVKAEIVSERGNRDDSHIFAQADPATINTGLSIRDKHLRRVDYFNVESFPMITMTSTKLMLRDAGGVGHFDLTIKGVTRPVRVKFQRVLQGSIVSYEGNFEINRLEFGIGEESTILDNVVRVRFKLKFLVSGS